jgi:hypothetical protein
MTLISFVMKTESHPITVKYAFIKSNYSDDRCEKILFITAILNI